VHKSNGRLNDGKDSVRDMKVQVYAVIRVDSNRSLVEDAIAVKEILPTVEDAEHEVERLTKLNQDKGARYFWQATRYFPAGREINSRS